MTWPLWEANTVHGYRTHLVEQVGGEPLCGQRTRGLTYGRQWNGQPYMLCRRCLVRAGEHS